MPAPHFEIGLLNSVSPSVAADDRGAQALRHDSAAARSEAQAPAVVRLKDRERGEANRRDRIHADQPPAGGRSDSPPAQGGAVVGRPAAEPLETFEAVTRGWLVSVREPPFSGRERLVPGYKWLLRATAVLPGPRGGCASHHQAASLGVQEASGRCGQPGIPTSPATPNRVRNERLPRTGAHAFVGCILAGTCARIRARGLGVISSRCTYATRTMSPLKPEAKRRVRPKGHNRVGLNC